MTERERLIELIGNYTEDKSARDMHSAKFEGQFADYLLENGVITLPKLKHKQTLYLIYNKTIKPLQVSSYMIRPEFNNLLQIHLYKNGFNGCCTLDDIGKTVFLTKEEAEKALKGGAEE